VNQSIEKLDNHDILEVVEEHFNILSEPMGDYSSLPTYLITKKAKFHATVMLSGDGGDELFWGYPRFLSQVGNAAYFNIPLSIRKPVVKLLRRIFNRTISAALDHPGSFADWTYNFQTYLFLDDLDKLVPGTSISKETQNLYSYTGLLSNKQDVLQWLKKNEFYGHLQRVLRKVDLTSMGNSLEVRVPFLDKRVIEFSNSIRPELSVKHRKLKYILKKALAEFIPPELIGHTKRGFSVPVNEYLRNELKEDLQTTCLQSKIYGADYINVAFYQSYIQDFLDIKHDNGWGVWHFYAWQKWAKKHNLI
jgi:asparagine synthase (glutamine-hydrolysing)